MFADVIATFGPVVKVSEVRTKFPEMIGHIMRRGRRVERGVYDISDATVPSGRAAMAKAVKATVTEAEAEGVVHTHRREIDVIDTITDENLIPEINPSYVPFGCYTTVLKVIQSKIFAPVYITGDSGNGKTLGVEQACAKARREAIIINITNETSEEDLIGSYFLKDGSMSWRDGPVIVAMRRGAVLCLDEVDQARPAIMALQTVAQGKPYFIKKTNELVHPATGFCVIATANTKGDGGGSDRFAGAQVLNEAFLERFNIVVEQDYPSGGIERRILKHHTDNEKLIERLVKFAAITRTAMRDGATTHCITTRRLVQICQNIEIFGDEVQGLTAAVNRFEADTRDSFIELYTKLYKADQSQITDAAAPPAQHDPIDDIMGTVSATTKSKYNPPF